jgi:hypothetical protein
MDGIGPKRSGIGAQVLRLVGLALLANTACSPGEGRRDASRNPEAGVYVVLDTIPVPDAADKVAIDTQALPLCCTEGVTLSLLVGATPCSFALPDPPLPNPNDFFIYLNDSLVDGHSTDGWAYDPTTASIVFLGTSCENIKSSPQDAVVQMLCRCVASPCGGYSSDLC